jgi:ParB family chromosome partitioning protein
MTSTTQTLRQLRLDEIQADPNNARKDFDAAELQELANTIREEGLLQPPVARVTDAGNIQLVAGERRLRACRLLGMETISVIMVEMDDKSATLAGLIENIQRANLDPFEEGEGYRAAMEAHGWDQKTLAQKIGKSKQAVSAALSRARVDAGVRKQMSEAHWSAGAVDEIVKLGKDRQVELIEAFGTKAPTVKQIREFKASENDAASPDVGTVPFVDPNLVTAGKEGELALLAAAVHDLTERLQRFGRTAKGRALLKESDAALELRKQLDSLHDWKILTDLRSHS